MRKPDPVDVDLPTRYKIRPEMQGRKWLGTYSVEIVRPAADERKEIPVTTLTGVSASEIYVKLGREVPTPPPEGEFDVEYLRSEIKGYMTDTGKQNVIKTVDFHNHMLDLLDLLPEPEPEPEPEPVEAEESD